MADSEQIIALLTSIKNDQGEIKQALRAIYGDTENQDDLIKKIGKSITTEIRTDMQKLERSLKEMETKIGSIPKILESLTKLITINQQLNPGYIKEIKDDVDFIRHEYYTLETKLNNISQKIR
ncbi:MAG: hypothetical protein U1C97_02830 [Candidatus Gracilibacteria bacterium]|nr:hypothetical protein [bacterium]MDZ4217228.1 hypothetical protein [Candidatus Gracilibacteria bacterium]